MTTTVGSLLERLAPMPTGRDGRAERGRAWLERHGLPTGREEAWRSTPVREVLAALETATPATPDADVVERSLVDDLAGDHGGPRLVVVNGGLVPELSDLDPGVAGLWLGGAEALRPRPRPPRGDEDQPADGFHALNWAAGRDVAAVLVDPGVRVEVPVHVVHLSLPGLDTSASHPRTVVRAGANSRLHVIETYAGRCGPSLTNASTRLVAGDGATVTHHRIQDESADAIHLGRIGIDQAGGSTVRSTSLLIGGRIARAALEVRLRGGGARVDLTGLARPVGHQQHDHVILVDHQASDGTSTQHFRGVVDDRAMSAFSGHVIVRPGTTGTDASQSNPNLVLRTTAQAETRPWLEILADDVRCTHGATVGRLDDEALFYLRSRGIALQEARAMLVAAFAAEITDAITPDSLREHVTSRLAQPGAPG
jgi:Fe-S cluster assembly protein SufD